MKMRLVSFDTLPGLRSVAKTRPGFDIVVLHAGRALSRLAPVRNWLATEIRKQPKLSAAIGSVGAVWAALVESFCGMIDPYISRCFPETRVVAVVTASGDIELHKIVKGAMTSLGPLSSIEDSAKAEIAKSKWTAIELRVRSDQVLQRTLSLPAASRDFLGPIIEHKLERLTPWRSECVLYGYHIVDGEGSAGGGFNVALAATSKDFVSGPLQALGEAGLVPTAIGPHQEILSEPLRVDFLRGAAKGNRTDTRRAFSRIALASFGLFAMVYLGSNLWVSDAVDAQREAGIRLMKARRLLKAASMGAIGDRERNLLQSKQPDKAMVVLIDRLATAIPQDTYLKELAVTSSKIRLVGVSGNAPALIGDLEAIGLVNVRFTSAVTREKDQKDSFEISADRPLSVVSESHD